MTGVVLVLLYPDSYQQDGGYHFLFARYAWMHPEMFVGVWTRPLFTFLYSFPAQMGYPAAKLFTVLICLVTGYHTFRLAETLRLDRPAWVLPLLFFQPAFFQLFSDTLTESLFALVLVCALRLHLAGFVATGALAASLLILVRPEGFFLGLLWGGWILARRHTGRFRRRLAWTLLLAAGSFLWWLAALLLSGDPLYIPHNWPPDWDVTGAAYGRGALWSYAVKLPEIAGPILWIFLVIGIVRALGSYPSSFIASVFLTVFTVHSIFRPLGLFGAAGYARYLVSVAPATALLGLIGWNFLAARIKPWRQLQTAAAAIIVMLSAAFSMFYVDAAVYTRDAHAIADMFGWFQENQRPVTRLIWSQAYMCILFDRDPLERPPLSSDKAANLQALRNSPAGTLVFWDGETGPSWYKITDRDLEDLGYVRLQSRNYELPGLLKRRWWFNDFGPRKQVMHLFYKEAG